PTTGPHPFLSSFLTNFNNNTTNILYKWDGINNIIRLFPSGIILDCNVARMPVSHNLIIFFHTIMSIFCLSVAQELLGQSWINLYSALGALCVLKDYLNGLSL